MMTSRPERNRTPGPAQTAHGGPAPAPGAEPAAPPPAGAAGAAGQTVQPAPGAAGQTVQPAPGAAGQTVQPAPGAGPAATPPSAAAPARRRLRWQGAARAAIAAGLLLFASFLVTAMRERTDSTTARGVERADPEAVTESAGVEFVRSDGEREIFRLEAARQATYADGSIRFTGGVALTAPGREDRDGFTMAASEAFVGAGQSDFEVNGGVRMAAGDGLVARTGAAAYSERADVVTMHDPAGPTTLVRAGLEAAGKDVVQDRGRGIITLDGEAEVRLTGNADRAAVDVAAAHATLADVDRYMRFEGGATVRAGEMTIVAETATARFGAGEDALESMALGGGVRLRSTAGADGGLRESRAGETTLHFDPATRRLQRVALTGAAAVELVGADGEEGSRIESGAMELTMAPGGAEIVGLAADGGVRLQLPAKPGEPRQEIRARSLTADGTPETGLNGILLDGEVAYDERHEASADRAAFSRTVHADRLEAGVNRGLAGLVDVRFEGGVRFADETRRAEADRAAYDLLGGTITLTPDADEGRTATLVDGSRTIEAGGDLEAALDGSRVSAGGGVQAVIAPPEAGPDEGADRVPALLERAQRINARAEAVEYDGGARQVTYQGQARMWQGNTSFEGETITIDQATGGLSVTGSARTVLQLVRQDEETGSQVSRTDAAAGKFVYDDEARRAVYEEEAVLRSDRGDLAADQTEVFLQSDGRTLDRFASTGTVRLRLEDRWATGDTLVYHEAEGRYDMEGAPVEIVEEADPDEADPGEAAETGEPSEPTCRSTKGLVLTFYRGSDIVAVDGRARSRTETSNGPCQPIEF